METELVAGDILASLSEQGDWGQEYAIGWLGGTRERKASLAVVRFVSKVGSNVACVLPPLAEWTMSTRGRSKPSIA